MLKTIACFHLFTGKDVNGLKLTDIFLMIFQLTVKIWSRVRH